MSKTTNYTLSLSKKTGKLWILEDVTPFFKPFKTYYFQEMGHYICKITTSGTGEELLASEAIQEAYLGKTSK